MDAPTPRRVLLERLAAALEGRPDVDLAVLFGSRARDEADAGSDVDLAVAGRDVDTLGVAADLTADLDLEADIVDLRDANIPLLDAILRDGVRAFEATPGRYATWRTALLFDMEWLRPWYRRMSDAWLERVEREGV